MRVAVQFRRKRKITSTTSTMVSPRVNSTSLTEARIVVVRSVRMWMSTEAGRVSLRRGRMFLMLLTTEMMFAPGCRWMLTITAGSLFIQAACRTSSIPSSTRATSLSLTGAPLR